jgi:hypothetical protein
MTPLALPTAAAPELLVPPTAIGRLVLLGHPVAHSLSPRFQNAALTAAGIPLRYEALDTPPDTLASVLDALISERAAGNVTIPHKEAVHARCDLRTPMAERVGAVNTFWCTLDGRLCGDNTDVSGFAAAARALLGDAAPTGLAIALVGAGGSAAAVLVPVIAAGPVRGWGTAGPASVRRGPMPPRRRTERADVRSWAASQNGRACTGARGRQCDGGGRPAATTADRILARAP